MSIYLVVPLTSNTSPLEALHKSIGEVQASVDALRTTVDGTKAKVDDLVNWKNRILGGAAVLTVIVTLIGFVVGKFWDYVTIKAPTAQPTVQAPPALPSK